MSSADLVCEDPKIWVFDELLSEDFLSHVDGLFEVSSLPEHHSAGRTSRSVDLDLDSDPKAQELFDVVRRIAGVREVEACRKALISDVSGVTQDAHVDHVSLNDLSEKFDDWQLGFLDLSKQSLSERHPGRVVPTFSIVCYFNNVGGIFFPDSNLRGRAIPGKRGRIIMFANYTDSQRPMHNPLSLHYGSYCQEKPKRVMTMGVLANETPPVLGTSNDARAIEGLIYCPGVADEPLRHDNPSYNPYYYEQRAEELKATEKPKPKESLAIILDATFDLGVWNISCKNMAGEEQYVVSGPPRQSISWLRGEVKKGVDPEDSFDVGLVTRDGKALMSDLESYSLDYVFGEQSMIMKAMAAAAEAQTQALEAGTPEEEALELGQVAAEVAKDAHYEGIVSSVWESRIGTIQGRVPDATRREAIEALCVNGGHAGHAMSDLKIKHSGKAPGDSGQQSAVDEIRKLFERADANLDGWLSKQELEGILQGIGANFSERQYALMFEHLDINQDGCLQYEEFLVWCFKMKLHSST